MHPLSIIHTFGAAATSIVRASADMFASASVSSLVVLAVKAPHIEVSDRMLSPPALTPSSVWPPPTPSSASGWTRTNKSDGPRIKSLVNSICQSSPSSLPQFYACSTAIHAHSTNSSQAFLLYDRFSPGNFKESKHCRNEPVFLASSHASNPPWQASEKC
jgi:hypothetical protein